MTSNRSKPVLTVRHRRAGIAALFAAVALVASGCQPTTHTVSGCVTFCGKPVTGGSVVLFGDGDRVYTGLISPDGRYSIPNVPVGEMRVTVRTHTTAPVGFRVGRPQPSAVNGPAGAAGGPPPPAIPNIPERYSVPEESGLTLTVGGTTDTFDIPLTR